MCNRQRFALRRLGVVILAWALAWAAEAGSLTAKPLRLMLPPGANSASLFLENTGGEPVLVQAEVMAWSQRDGAEVLEPSQDLIVSPPVFKVAPGAAQTVRVGMMRPNDAARELTYRLFLQEVPPPMRPGEQELRVALRLSLPVFIQPRGKVAPQLTWRAARGPQGAIVLSLTNSGNAHVQAIDCRLYDGNNALIAESNLGGYVLPGQSRSWSIASSKPWGGGRIRLMARTDAGDVSAQVEAE